MSVTKQGGNPANAAGSGPPGVAAPLAAGLAGWWARARATARRSIDEARLLWILHRARPRPKSPAAALTTVARRLLPLAVAGDHTPRAAIAAAWRDPGRRPWLLTGALALVLVLALVVAAPLTWGRPARAPAAAQATQPPGQPGQTEPPPPTAQPAQPAQPAEPPPEGQPPAPAQPGPVDGRMPPGPIQLGLAALPLLLGLFWLLSAWLVDAEARRAFVIQEPWGERRTVAYSCLAVGCVFPLILAGLIFAAWGFVSFVVYVANRQNWAAGLQAGALVLLVCAVFLLGRSIVVRWRMSSQ